MKKITKLLSIIFSFIGLATLAACNSSGVVAEMTAKTVTASKAVIGIEFEQNDNIESGAATAHVKRNDYDPNTKKYSLSTNEQNDLLVEFGSNKLSATVTFDTLSASSKYKFELYVTFDNNDSLITSLEVETTEEEAVEIKTVDDFYAMSNNNKGEYILMNDLDFGGTYSNKFSTKAFMGSFDGRGHTLKNIVLTETTNMGVFGLTQDATIKNLNVENKVNDKVVNMFTIDNMTSNTNFGALIGKAISTKVTNCHVNNISTKTNAISSSVELNIGGLVGLSNGSSFDNCSADGVNFSLNNARKNISAGLFAGNVDSTGCGDFFANECFATGSVDIKLYYQSSYSTTTTYTRIGGFAGAIATNSPVKYCYSDASVTVTLHEGSTNKNDYSLYVGGFLGNNGAGGNVNISKSYANSKINVYAGSLASDKYQDAYATKQMNVQATYIGGFAGKLNKYIDSIKDCGFNLDSNSCASVLDQGVIKTKDTTLDSSKTYYTLAENYMKQATPKEELLPIYYKISAELTKDTSLNSTKTYYVLDGGDYIAVAEPKEEDLGTYYEVTKTPAIAVNTLKEDTELPEGDLYTISNDLTAVTDPKVDDLDKYYEDHTFLYFDSANAYGLAYGSVTFTPAANTDAYKDANASDGGCVYKFLTK